MFNTTLYYPWIDIHDDSWIKTAILYWDEIRTIVPLGLTSSPYNSEIAKILEHENVLRPFQVTPSSREVIEASDIVMHHLSTPEGMRIIASSKDDFSVNKNKFSYGLQQNLGLFDNKIHINKIGHNLMNLIENAKIDDDGYVNLNNRFSSYYMSILANKIAKYNNFSTVADSNIYHQFNTKLNLDGYSPSQNKTYIKCPACKNIFDGLTQETIKNTGKCPYCDKDILYFFQNDYDRQRPYQENPQYLVDGILADFVIKNIYIPNSVSINKILNFREKHIDELSAFRGALQDITQSVLNSGEIDDIRALRQRVEVAYKHKVCPEIKKLKAQLRNAKVQYFLSDFTISGMASILGTAFSNTLGTAALLATASASIGVRSVMYWTERNNLRNNPYSYILSMERHLK